MCKLRFEDILKPIAMKRKTNIRNGFFVTLLTLITACGGSAIPDSSDPVKFYVGSSDGRREYSIFLCELNPVSQELILVDSFPGARGSGYLDLSPDGQTLFATSGASVPGDDRNNSVAAYRVNPADQSLEFINRQSSQGSGNCHVHSSPDGKYVFAANYNSGHATAIPVEESGKLKPATSVMQGEGSGPITSRQKGPHAHMVMMDPGGKFLLVPDLGTDKVMNYAFDEQSGILSPNPNQNYLKMEPGYGPRHLAFHPDKNLVFILGEMSAMVTACSFDPETGVLSVINTASIVEDGFDGNLQSAAIRVHPNGKFVYASNRADESNLAIFSIDSNGGITQTGIFKDIPYWPRDFNLSPDGQYLLVAGARVNEIALYRVDMNTGGLENMNTSLEIPNPTCILFPGSE